MADKRIDQLVAATTLGNNDLLVLEQNNQAKKMSGATLASFVYNAATDKIAEVNQAVADAQDAVDSLEEQKNEIAQAIADMAQYGTDATLTTTGVAADAKAAGDRIKDAETAALAGLDQGTISGVPIASFDDGADDVPVKALKIAIEPQQDLHGYDNPWPAGGGKNLLPIALETTAINGITATVLTDADGNKNGIRFSGTRLDPNTNIDIYNDALPAGIVAGGSYIFSWGYAIPAFQIITYDSNSQRTVLINQSSLNTVTVTIPADAITLHVRVAIDTDQTLNTTIYPMARLSTVADATFAPYSNICPISGWTGVNVMRTGKNLFDPNKCVNATVNSDGSITFSKTGYNAAFYYDTLPAGTYKINYTSDTVGGTLDRLWKVNQDGTIGPRLAALNETVYVFTLQTKTKICLGRANNSPSGYTLSNVQLESGSEATDYEPFGMTYPIAFPVGAGTVYGGTLDVTNGVLMVDRAKITLNGSETWSDATNGAYYVTYDSTTLSYKFSSDVRATCDAYKYKGTRSQGYSSYLSNGEFGLFYSHGTSGWREIFFKNESITSLNDFKAELAQNPIMVVYELATPIAYTLTPLVVRTLLVLNNIWADTGNILDLIYRRQPISDADIQQQIDEIRDVIADREDNGVASKNYSTGSLILIDNVLYETTGPITTGESIVPDYNCTPTTVAAQIAYIKSIVNGLGNLAYLSYENA